MNVIKPKIACRLADAVEGMKRRKWSIKENLPVRFPTVTTVCPPMVEEVEPAVIMWLPCCPRIWLAVATTSCTFKVVTGRWERIPVDADCNTSCCGICNILIVYTRSHVKLKIYITI